MPPSRARLTLFLACCLAAVPALAAKVTKVEIRGLPDEAMEANVRSALSLNDELGKDLRARRLGYLLRVAEDEARQALEPFGYYAPTVTVTRSDRASADANDGSGARARDDGDDAGDGNAEDAAGDDANARRSAASDRTLTVTIDIQPGEPVRVRGFDLGVDGPASADAGVASALDAFHPRAGEVLDHQRYEAGKARVALALANHGYFDAGFASHRIEVTRAQHAADLDLRWTSGARYALGEARFTQAPNAVIDPRLLDKLVPWTLGDAYDEAELDRLRKSLVALDYFGLVDVQATPDAAADRRVPVDVQLTPARRSIYTWGASYGTLSGPGISAGVERRYLNARGHKALAQIDYADKRKTATLQYRIPAFAWLDGWYTASLQAADEVTDYVNSRRLELVASRSGQYNDHLNLVASMHVLRERWAYNVADDGGGAMAPIDYRFASFVYPSLRAEYIDVDERMAPRRGAGGTLTLRGGTGGSDGKATFTQLHATVQWFHGFDADSRLIARGELGHTFTKDLLDLPPSLRFYAGGDRSVRGYGWHEIGPKVDTDFGDYYTGAPNVVTASLEYERYFKGPWGAAVFVDSGSAFEGRRPDMHTGVGIGLRWRSPVGPVRIDIAHGLKSPDSPVTIHLNIGADL
ncbi:outer membrane protein assembly factor [Thermomonas brevis]|uniref:Translocation and assembly module subunit TamA n=1 Tax=Thermomonas brevis TaxID=215691 RepID=A0A7G9QPC1_9GAMM|nr:autotransporter assembly complex family protein [Thermomonas brevis]QNN45196.1 outer membrane protein assembly factor [Thermomonas brevis]